jgi:hypothetical protein
MNTFRRRLPAVLDPGQRKSLSPWAATSLPEKRQKCYLVELAEGEGGLAERSPDVVAKWAAMPGARGIRIRMRDGLPMAC